MLTDLKITTRRGYTSILESLLLPRFGHLPITHIDSAAASILDLDLSKRRLSQSTRNNAQIVLRSVLRFAASRGFLPHSVTNLPRLKPIGQGILEIPTDRNIQTLLTHAAPSHRLAFALMAFAGLRPNEVRALRRRDILLRYENSNQNPIGGFLSIREGRSHNETHTPKTGQREIPIAPALAPLLAHTSTLPRDAFVALNERALPWGQYGLDRAFQRACKRIQLEGFSVYALRHYAITSWLRAGIPVHVVQRMAGHHNLATTQRYVHHLKADLEDAAHRLATLTSPASPAP